MDRKLPERSGRRWVMIFVALIAGLLTSVTSTVHAQAIQKPARQAVEPQVNAPANAANQPIAARKDDGGLKFDQMLAPSGLSQSVKIMILLTLLSLVPSILMMTTCFIRFIIVFGLLRQALGTQNLPPNQVVSALALFLTMFVMTPIWQECYREGVEPYVNNQPIPNLVAGEEPLKRVFLNAFQPMQRFMSEQIHNAGGEDVVFMLVDYRRPAPGSLAANEWREPETFDEIEPSIIITAYMLSELKSAFVIGFQIFLPFLVIDMVVSMLLTAMGMMMLPPSLVSLPFKLMLFVLIDGWTLTVQMLLHSVTGSG